MVNEAAQIYTIEGVAAAVLILITAYVVVGGTYILTPGDVHIYDMQLEQLGNDVLQTMDTRLMIEENGEYSLDDLSHLEEYIQNSDGAGFVNEFRAKSGDIIGIESRTLKMRSYVYVNCGAGKQALFSSTEPYTGRDHYVTVKHWVHVKGAKPTFLDASFDECWAASPAHTVLLEVVLWRD